jgi:predicted CopG family antitoxin
MSRSIRVEEDTHRALAALKGEDETFSDVVLRLAGEKSLLELAGILSDEQANALEGAIEERRERRNESLDANADELDEGDATG